MTDRRRLLSALSALALTCLLAGALSAQAEQAEKDHIRVAVEGSITPHRLPRSGSAPVKVSVGAQISSTDGAPPPRLRQITILINRNGRFDAAGLPLCSYRDVQPATTQGALEACRGSLVGQGYFSSKLLLGASAKFPTSGKLYAFNARLHGHPAILAHVYGTDPVPTSFSFYFELRPAHGAYGTQMTASLADVGAGAGYVTGLSLKLARNYRSHGAAHSYVSASCPLPPGVHVSSFPFARTSFAFQGGKTVSETLTRSCSARG